MTYLDNAIGLLNLALKSQTHDGIQDVGAVDDALGIHQCIVQGLPPTFPVPMRVAGWLGCTCELPERPCTVHG